MGSILKAKEVLGDLEAEIKDLKASLNAKARLVCISIGSDMGTQSYLSSIKRVLNGVYGIDVQVEELPADCEEERVAATIGSLNQDESVSAIMLMRPTPQHLNLAALQKLIAPHKDVDGVNPLNCAGFWLGNDESFGSCTAEAALYMLNAMVGSPRGLDVVVVGRSHEVGRPIAELLVRQDATVTICHSATDDLTEHLKEADAVISCTGVAHLIDGSMLKSGAYVIDVGMSMLDGMLVGDVDLDTAVDKVSLITPALGGVGTVTTHILAKHVIEASAQQ